MCGVGSAVHLCGASASIVCIARRELRSERVNDVILLLFVLSAVFAKLTNTECQKAHSPRLPKPIVVAV